MFFSLTTTYSKLSLHYACIPLPELSVEETVRETLSADANTLKDSVAPQLVKNQVSVHQAGLLQLVGDDAADKVGRGVAYDDNRTPD